MTTWLLTLVLMASLGALGYRQGAIKVAFSTAGIVVGALLAVPLGNLLRPLVISMGAKNPLVAYLIPPAIVFVLFSIVFKVAAAAVHQKTDVYFKYRAGDLRLALWERVNQRLGACLGPLNAVLYVILISFVVYSLSYPTVQLASEDGDPSWMRLLNRMGRDLQSSGFSKVPRAMDKRMDWYDAADLAGVLYKNPLLEARMARYPAFLGLSERGEFQNIGSDKDFSEMRARREPIMNLLRQDKIQTVVQNPDLLRTIWAIVQPDMKDLSHYLETGKSAKYDAELILGRWTFDVNQTMVAVRRAKPNMSAKDAGAMKRWIAATFATTSLVVMPDHQLLLKNLPQTRQMTAPPTAPTGVQNLSAQWKGGNGSYEMTFSGGATVNATVEGDRLRFSFEGTELAFSRET